MRLTWTIGGQKHGETALEYVERADTLSIDEVLIDRDLRAHFGISDDAEIKALKLRSRPFWRTFFIARAKGIFERDGSRYSAVRFIERKNGSCGQKPFSAAEIDAIVDGVGSWNR